MRFRFPAKRFASLRRSLKGRVQFYQRVLRHPHTPRAAKILLGLAIGYALLPFDFIPDFIPVIGHLDDAIIVPGLLMLAMRLVPKEVLEECRKRDGRQEL